MTISKIFFWFCLSFTGGIFVSSTLGILPGAKVYLLVPGLILALTLISALWKYKTSVVIGFCLLFLVLGIWRHQTAELKMSHNELRKFNDLEEKITLIGTVSAEPDVRETHTKLTVNNLRPVDVKPKPINGKVLVVVRKYPEYQYGDELKITGLFKTPPVFEDFNYKNFLAKDGIYSVIYWPKIELISENQGNFIYAKILQFKDKLRESIEQNLSPPQSSILGAMILGDQRKMSEDLKEKLNLSGTRHITAISGMNITILSGILMYLGIMMGLWRSQAFYFAIILLTLYIIMVGLSPSVVRAGIMGGLFLLAQKVGRPEIAGRSIVFAATLMLVVNPLLLRLDVGFQLSFLAMLGIIYFEPIIRNWIVSLPPSRETVKRYVYYLRNVRYHFFSMIFLRSSMLKSVGAMTLAAQIFTLPILIYNFGYISLVAPFTNILIVPLLPLIMISGFIFGLVGIVFQPLGWILSWPVWLSLSYLTKIVDFFSEPWAAKTFENVHWVWLIIFYLILGLITWQLNEKQKLKFLNY